MKCNWVFSFHNIYRWNEFVDLFAILEKFWPKFNCSNITGVLSLGVPWHPQIFRSSDGPALTKFNAMQFNGEFERKIKDSFSVVWRAPYKYLTIITEIIKLLI